MKKEPQQLKEFEVIGKAIPKFTVNPLDYIKATSQEKKDIDSNEDMLQKIKQATIQFKMAELVKTLLQEQMKNSVYAQPMQPTMYQDGGKVVKEVYSLTPAERKWYLENGYDIEEDGVMEYAKGGTVNGDNTIPDSFYSESNVLPAVEIKAKRKTNSYQPTITTTGGYTSLDGTWDKPISPKWAQWVEDTTLDTATDQVPGPAGNAIMMSKMAYDFSQGLPLTAFSNLLKVPASPPIDFLINAGQKNPSPLSVENLDKYLFENLDRYKTAKSFSGPSRPGLGYAKGGLVKGGTEKVQAYQQWLNKTYGTKLAEDGAWGKGTQAAYDKYVKGASSAYEDMPKTSFESTAIKANTNKPNPNIISPYGAPTAPGNTPAYDYPAGPDLSLFHQIPGVKKKVYEDFVQDNILIPSEGKSSTVSATPKRNPSTYAIEKEMQNDYVQGKKPKVKRVSQQPINVTENCAPDDENCIDNINSPKAAKQPATLKIEKELQDEYKQAVATKAISKPTMISKSLPDSKETQKNFENMAEEVRAEAEKRLKAYYKTNNVKVEIAEIKRSAKAQEAAKSKGASKTEFGLHGVGMAADYRITIDGKKQSGSTAQSLKPYQILGGVARDKDLFWGWGWDSGHVGNTRFLADTFREHPELATLDDVLAFYGQKQDTAGMHLKNTLSVLDSLYNTPTDRVYTGKPTTKEPLLDAIYPENYKHGGEVIDEYEVDSMTPEEIAKLQAEGYDVEVDGVMHYAKGGRVNDPLKGVMIGGVPFYLAPIEAQNKYLQTMLPSPTLPNDNWEYKKQDKTPSKTKDFVAAQDNTRVDIKTSKKIPYKKPDLLPTDKEFAEQNKRYDSNRIARAIDESGVGNLANNLFNASMVVDGAMLGEQLLKYGVNKALTSYGKEAFTPDLGDVGMALRNPTKSTATVKPTAVAKPWQMQELPGLHLKSTMEGDAISKIVEPKTGLVNVEQALAIIGKESGGADKVALIRQSLGDKLPKKMDYNEFRKSVQDQLIPLETRFSIGRSDYGLQRLKYYEQNSDRINQLNKINELINSYESAYSTVYSSVKPTINSEGKYNITIPETILGNKITKTFDTYDEAVEYLWSNEGEGAMRKLSDVRNSNVKRLQQERNNVPPDSSIPIENRTLILGNKSKFGTGSSAHGNPEETLGHVHFLIDAESPDVLTVSQIQSDAFQSHYNIMSKSKEEAISKFKVRSERDPDFDLLAMTNEQKLMAQAEIENFDQKSLLAKNHQERYLQELVNYAGKRGDVNKVRVPTPETAAKVQNYKKVPAERPIGHEGYWDVNTSGKYSSEHETILKKYSEQPKTIKKLFGKEPKIVTDSKGNTWYEFDIPDKFKKGKGEIKAFSIAPYALPTLGATGVAAAASQDKKNK